MPDTKKYLIVKGCAGLGNRLVSVFSAIKYCEKNDRTLVIDWSDGQFDKKGIDAFDKCFDLVHVKNELLQNIDNWLHLTHSSGLFKQNPNNHHYSLYLDKQSPFWSKFPEQLFFSEGLRKLRRRWQPIHQATFFNSLSFGSDLNNKHSEDVLYFIDFLPYIDYAQLPEYIQVKPFLQQQVNQFDEQNNLKNAIGIHIRYSDKKPTSDVQKIINSIKQQHLNSAIFLSTDSIEIEKLFLMNFPEVILYPKLKPELNGIGLHQWALYNNEEDLKYTLFEESVMEMFLLSKCQYLYYQGNSTFSNISKVYHQNKNNCYDWLKL